MHSIRCAPKSASSALSAMQRAKAQEHFPPGRLTDTLTSGEDTAPVPVSLSAENCADKEKGAYTGEVAANMLVSAGCEYTILGHSERRQYYGETDAKLVEKTKLALANGLKVILCVGENLDEREAGKHFDVCEAQIKNVLYNFTEEDMKNIVVAYEPVWAIGTGKTATAEQAEEIHAFIRKVIADKFGAQVAEDTTILYGGSCNAKNATELFSQPDVDGGLIGGASLKADDFFSICAQASEIKED